MNKQIFLSFALVALVSFSAFGGADPTNKPAKTDKKKIEVVQNKKEDNPESRIRGALDYFTTKFESRNTKIVIGIASSVISIYAIHKIMYIKCPWYRNWVDGVDENLEENKMPWAQT